MNDTYIVFLTLALAVAIAAGGFFIPMWVRRGRRASSKPPAP